MCNRSDRGRGRWPLAHGAVPWLAAVLLAVPAAGSLAGAAAVDGAARADGFDPSASASAPRRAPSRPLYLVRCWQDGRLLFEERDVALAADVTAGLKLRGTDRQRQPVMVADTGSATCLIRGGGK